MFDPSVTSYRFRSIVRLAHNTVSPYNSVCKYLVKLKSYLFSLYQWSIFNKHNYVL